MSKKLVIVESPAKARTIHRLLRGDSQVVASMGHIRDLPEREFGVDIARGFRPRYVLTPNGKRVAPRLRKAAAAADEVYLATDPDREGEAIAWHIQEVLKSNVSAPFHRISFHEITRRAIDEAFQAPGPIDQRKVDAQQARRILDRIVGYQISPLLWKRIRRGTSAGRVQSVALRLVCEREREIQNFVPREYWNLEGIFVHGETPETTFKARLVELDGGKPDVPNAEIAETLAGELENAAFAVSDVARREKKKRAPAPFITSTLQQAAGNLLKMSPGRTMRIAQELYEGVDVGEGGPTGLITYMRTDSVRVAPEARDAARAFIRDHFGPEYVPARPNVYRSRKTAQEAHEAIRPTDPGRTPESVASHLSRDQLGLYRLIWNRFIASQMAPARILEHSIDIDAAGDSLQHQYRFCAIATQILFPGFQKVYQAGPDPEGNVDSQQPDDLASRLPDAAVGDPVRLIELERHQKFTEPPPRFTEATLVRELERNGVGRPSTYAVVVSTIQDRDYVRREKGRLVPTSLGFTVNDFLVGRFPQLFDVAFTARMEAQLDEIEEGRIEWRQMLNDFFLQFRQWLQEVRYAETPSPEDAAELLKAFPDELPPLSPDQRSDGFNERLFLRSLKHQVLEAGKRLTDRQWRVLLRLTVRYIAALPEVQAAAERIGVLDQINAAAERDRQQEEQTGRNRDGAEERMRVARRLLDALAAVEWAPPSGRGNRRNGRRYDDRAFYESLRRQASTGRTLTDAQLEALKKLVVRYREQVPDFQALATELNLPVNDETDPLLSELMALLDQIKEWRSPSGSGRKRRDDKSFAESLREQFKRSGRLTKRQTAALKRLLARYADQISEYASRAAELGLPEPDVDARKSTAESSAATPDAPDWGNCPNCGLPLVQRKGRRGPFLGCSQYPKCRYTASIPASTESE